MKTPKENIDDPIVFDGIPRSFFRKDARKNDPPIYEENEEYLQDYHDKALKINPLNNFESFKKIKNLPKSLSENHLMLLITKAKKNLQNVERNHSPKKTKYLRILTILENI